MKNTIKQKNQKGSVLVEVLVVVAIFSVFLTVVMRAMLSNLQATIDAKVRSNGIFHAQQAMEMFIRERALLGWSDFRTQAFSWNSTICINGALINPATETLADFPGNDAKNLNGVCPAGYNLVSPNPADGSFRREAVITYSPIAPVVATDINKVNVKISVYWPSSKANGPEHHITIENDFQDW